MPVSLLKEAAVLGIDAEDLVAHIRTTAAPAADKETNR